MIRIDDTIMASAVLILYNTNIITIFASPIFIPGTENESGKRLSIYDIIIAMVIVIPSSAVLFVFISD